jgi:hypothetical protein
MPALNRKRNLREYISGYVDGEGSFCVSFSKRRKFLVGWETKPSLSVSQNEERANVLYLIQKVLGCGFMRRDNSDNTLKYEVRGLSDLIKKVIPHFEVYPLLSPKQKDFSLFKKICFLMQKGEHRKAAGLRKIVPLACQMNPSGKRKYTKEDILKTLR